MKKILALFAGTAAILSIGLAFAGEAMTMTKDSGVAEWRDYDTLRNSFFEIGAQADVREESEYGAGGSAAGGMSPEGMMAEQEVDLTAIDPGFTRGIGTPINRISEGSIMHMPGVLKVIDPSL